MILAHRHKVTATGLLDHNLWSIRTGEKHHITTHMLQLLC